MKVVKGPDNSTELISQWIRSYEKDLLRLCCVYLLDVTLSEDAVQETFWKAYRRIGDFRGDCSPRTWLVRIAINVCKDISRTAWFRMQRSAPPLDRLQPAQEEGEWEIRSALVAEILRLPRALREVVLLYHYEGFSQAETAQALHISAATVSRRLDRAYALFKHMLKEEPTHEA